MVWRSRRTPAETAIAIGVDGCRGKDGLGGWVAASLHPDGTTSIRRLAALGDARARVIGVDVPMGLPAKAGFRECDRQARALLKPHGRASSVFPVPSRSLLSRAQYRAWGGAGLSIQAFFLRPRLREADRILLSDPAARRRLLEVHPEVSFAEMGGVRGSKKTAMGSSSRRRRLARIFPDLEARLGAVEWRRTSVAPDDLLDAYAVLWTALRALEDRHHELGDGACDARGLPMRIVV